MILVPAHLIQTLEDLWVGADAVGNRQVNFQNVGIQLRSIFILNLHFDQVLAWSAQAQRLASSIVATIILDRFESKKYLEVNSGMALIHLQKQTLTPKTLN